MIHYLLYFLNYIRSRLLTEFDRTFTEMIKTLYVPEKSPFIPDEWRDATWDSRNDLISAHADSFVIPLELIYFCETSKAATTVIFRTAMAG